MLEYTKKVDSFPLVSLSIKANISSRCWLNAILTADAIWYQSTEVSEWAPWELAQLHLHVNYTPTTQNQKNCVQTDLCQHFFTERIVNIWNKLDDDTVSAQMLNIFKNKLQKM